MAKEYTVEEVKKHNKKTDMWFIWRGKVLDVTKFLDEHPGGPDVLLEVAGADSTSGFEDIGHSAEAISLAEGLVIGTVQGAKASSSSSASAPSQASKLAAKPVQAKTDNTGYILPVLLIVIAILAYYIYA